MKDRRAFKPADMRENQRDLNPQELANWLYPQPEQSSDESFSGKFYFTPHARCRADERGISMDWVLWRLYSGNTTIYGVEGGGKDRHVLYDQPSGEFVIAIVQGLRVITVMHASHRIHEIPPPYLEQAHELSLKIDKR